MNREDKVFAEQIRIWRKSKGLTQSEAAKIFGTSANSISNWERGNLPSKYFQEIISKELNIKESVLFKEPEIKNFHIILKKKRIEAGLTQYELANHLGYSQATIQKWERGGRIFTLALEDVCMYFEINIDELENGGCH